MTRDFHRLVIAAPAQPLHGQGNGHDVIDVLAAQLAGEQAREQRGERELAAKLERMHQRIGGKIVSERGTRGVVGRRLGKTASANDAARRLEGAARAERSIEARQLGFALRAEQRARRAAAHETAAAEKYARELFSHKLHGPCGL